MFFIKKPLYKMIYLLYILAYKHMTKEYFSSKEWYKEKGNAEFQFNFRGLLLIIFFQKTNIMNNTDWYSTI